MSETNQQANASKIPQVFATAVKKELLTSGGGWGGKNSTAVIEAICDEAYGAEEGFDTIRLYVSQLVNPSAFRQKLEDKGLVPKAEKGSRKSGVDVLAGL